MLKALAIETVYGLIDLVDAGKQSRRLGPDQGVVHYKEDLRERLFPTQPHGKAERTLDVGILNIVRGLSREQKIELVALIWLGRDGGDWGHWLERGKSEVDGSQSNTPVSVKG